MDWILGKVIDQSHYCASVGNIKITDLVFADDAILLMKKVQVMTLEVLHETKILDLKISWTKTKVQSFRNLLNDIIISIYACGGGCKMVYCKMNEGLARIRGTSIMKWITEMHKYWREPEEGMSETFLP